MSLAPQPTQNDDAVLFRRFLDGEDPAFRALFQKYNQRLYVYCLKIVGGHQQAEDVTQEMWERVIGLRRNPQSVENPGGLFLRMARNLCIDHLRSVRPVVPIEEIEDTPRMLEQSHEPSEPEELALAMLEKLSYEYREVLILNLYCGYRFDEIAAMMGKTPDAIWARASRARAQLRRMVAAAIAPEPDAPPPVHRTRNHPRTEDRL